MKIVFGVFLFIFGVAVFFYPEKLRQYHINSFVSGLKIFGMYDKSVDWEKKYAGVWLYRLTGIICFFVSLLIFYGLIRNGLN